VYGLKRVSEHRPEKAWQKRADLFADARKTPAPSSPVPFFRPLWLLATPELLEQHRGRPRRQGALEILDGPERIESGWWDGDDVARDYYVARDARGSFLWIYRDNGGARQWFLHGISG
jgi:protein ImuB